MPPPAGTLESIDEGTAEVLCQRVKDDLQEYGPQSLANTAWAIAKSGFAMYITFRPNFHHFDRFELDFRGHIHVWGAAFSCLRLKWADMVLI